MRSRLRISGQPIQPMLVTFPFGLFVCAVVFDLVDVVGGPTFLGEVGYWTLVAALFAAVLTAGLGLIDLWDVPAGRTRRVALTFNLVNTAMAVLFVFVCLIRAGSPERGSNAGLVLVELLAVAVGVAGVRLGAVLMRRFDEAGREADDHALSTARPQGNRYERPGRVQGGEHHGVPGQRLGLPVTGGVDEDVLGGW